MKKIGVLIQNQKEFNKIIRMLKIDTIAPKLEQWGKHPIYVSAKEEGMRITIWEHEFDEIQTFKEWYARRIYDFMKKSYEL